MYRTLEHWACVGLSLVALVGSGAADHHHDNLYQIHRVEKEYRVLRARDSTCESGYSLCAASLGGDCCPSNYACAQTYCYATTAGPTSACGASGYYNCGSDSPGFCCPTNYQCKTDGCYPTAGVTSTETCDTGYILCPSSLNGGCCASGMGCGYSNCYSTDPSTYTVTSDVTTTDSAGATTTYVSTRTTTTTPSATGTKATATALPKLVQSTVAKVAAVETSTSSGVSLTQSQLGGIIAGVVIVFLAVVVAAFLVIRRLRKTARAVKESRHGSSAANQTATTSKPGYRTASVSVIEVDSQYAADPLMASPRNRPPHLRARSDTSFDGIRPSPARSPGLSSGQSTPPAWAGHNNPMQYPEESIRHPSMDSGTGGYYNPVQNSRESQVYSQASGHRGSYDSQATNANPHWSYVSEAPGSTSGAHGVSELESTDEAGGRIRSNSGATSPHPRRNSDPHQRNRSDSSAPVMTPLGTVNEINELHGYYGPADRQVGQTAARPQSGVSPQTET